MAADAAGERLGAFRADGNGIAAYRVEGGEDKRVRIHDGRTLEVEHEFRAHERTVTGAGWHPKLPILATRDEGRVRIWDTETQRKV